MFLPGGLSLLLLLLLLLLFVAVVVVVVVGGGGGGGGGWLSSWCGCCRCFVGFFMLKVEVQKDLGPFWDLAFTTNKFQKTVSTEIFSDRKIHRRIQATFSSSHQILFDILQVRACLSADVGNFSEFQTWRKVFSVDHFIFNIISYLSIISYPISYPTLHFCGDLHICRRCLDSFSTVFGSQQGSGNEMSQMPMRYH